MSRLDVPTTAPDRLVTFWHDEQPADDPVDIIVDEDGGRVFVALSPHADRDSLSLSLSVALTRHLRSSWLYIGVEDVP